MMLPKRIKHIVHCICKSNVNDCITAAEVTAISIDTNIVACEELFFRQPNVLRIGRIIGTVLLFKLLKSIVLLLFSV